ncbi:MAG: class I tRNA ligase family protein [Azospirillaceae bacterium]
MTRSDPDAPAPAGIPTPADAPDRLIVTLPPPTPNGGLHVGHIAGPFLAADVFAKAHKQAGKAVFVTTYNDSNQSYVRVTAERQGVDPMTLALGNGRDIVETLGLYGSDIDAYVQPDADSDRFARELFLRLHADGALVAKDMPFFWSPARGAFLDEAGVTGFCPVCLDACKCGVCEGCTTVTTAKTILAPRDTVTGDTDLEIRRVRVLVLEVERWRDAIAAFYAANPRFRPRYRWVVEDALAAGRLADFPVTLPGDWGIAVEHPDFPGQVINAWAEVMADLLYCYRRAAEETEAPRPPAVVNFFGHDNSYFYAIVHVALHAAAGETAWLPHATVINEFYNLDNAKFSTSAGHVLWARDLVARHDPDLIRFFLALHSPGFEKGNFTEAEMTAVIETEVASVWHRLATALNEAAGARPLAGAAPEPVLADAAGRAVRRVARSYAVERFHLRQAAEDLLHLLRFAAERAGAIDAAPDPTARAAGVVALLHGFAEAAYPVMPAAAARLGAALRDLAADRRPDLPPSLFLSPLRATRDGMAAPAAAAS